MTELERALADLDVEWPETPAFDLRSPAHTRRRRLLAGAVAALLALGVALAVSPARSAILRFFHLGGVTIQRVQTLPPAQGGALRDALGLPIAHADAERLLGRPFAVRDARVYRDGAVVSALIQRDPPVLLSELRTGRDPFLLKKFASGSTQVEPVSLGAGVPAIWIYGGRHVFMAPALPPRYAGNTLLWQRGGITYRLEGRALTLAHARALARALR
jgi:hypothetical protein